MSAYKFIDNCDEQPPQTPIVMGSVGVDDSPRATGSGGWRGRLPGGTVRQLNDCANSGEGAQCFGSSGNGAARGNGLALLILLGVIVYVSNKS